jgi:hypothetical protein
MNDAVIRAADLNSPILQPWAKEELRKRNESILSGKPGYSVQVICIPLGVPAFVLHPVQPFYTDRRHGHHDQPGES